MAVPDFHGDAVGGCQAARKAMRGQELDWRALSKLIDTAVQVGEDESDAEAAGLLHALLQSLPEPPITAAHEKLGGSGGNGGVGSLHALANSLPAPPSSLYSLPTTQPPIQPPALRQPDSLQATATKAQRLPDSMASVGVERSRRVHAGLRPASGATFGYYAEDDGVEGDLLAERPPSALFNDRLFGEPTAARRAPQPPRMDLRMSCGTPPPPLDEEMPPVSPFFARIRPSDIEEARATVRRASISRRRRNTLAAAEQQRSTWCASATATDPVF
ncbi:hypothetical protein EV174_006007, partial [Coemansia sp. RSA 2320]